MMKRLSALAMALLVLALHVTALAQDEEEERDLLEVCFYGGLGMPTGGISDFHDSLGAKTGWSFGVDMGYFVKYNLVVGVNFVFTQFGVDAVNAANEPTEADGTHHRLYNPNLYAKYYFVGESNFEPYVKAHVGIENAKFMTGRVMPTPHYWATSYDPVLAYGVGAGVFLYSSDYSGLFVEANYHMARSKDAEREYADETLVFGENLAVLDIHAGIRILIGSGD
ncbi:MAG: outer membrane beta-barrel protein [bacterium]